jgi:hypothetical protein
MSLSPTPDTLFVLPTNSFSIPAQQANGDNIQPPPSVNLRVHVKIGLLLPSSLVGTKPRKKWGMEGNFDVVLPLGGEVDIGVRVREEDLALLDPRPSLRNTDRPVGAFEEGPRMKEIVESVEELVQTNMRRLLHSVGNRPDALFTPLTLRTKIP